MSKIQVEVKWKSGAKGGVMLDPELIESGDVIALPSKQVLKLVGATAHGVKQYEEIDPPSKEELEAAEDVENADGDPAGVAFKFLSKGLKFPEPGPSKPLLDNDGKALPPPVDPKGLESSGKNMRRVE